MAGLAYLLERSLNRNVCAHDVITSYYLNRSEQFPVDFRLYLQFNRKYEAAQLPLDFQTLRIPLLADALNLDERPGFCVSKAVNRLAPGIYKR